MVCCSTLRVAWDVLREQSERIAQIHMEASGQLSDAATRLNEFLKRQKTERIPVSSSSSSSSSLDGSHRYSVGYCHLFCKGISALVLDVDVA